MSELRIGFGALLPTLADQLDRQGFSYDAAVMSRFETQRQAINTLYVPGLMTESQHDAITNKLNKEVVRHVKECIKDVA